MAAAYKTEEEKERVVLAAVDCGDGEETGYSMRELAELAETAGADVAGQLIQKREAVHPGTYIGKGKIEELKELVRQQGASAVICDDELSPAQIMNLRDELQIKVIDRTILILDIFAAHAATKEGQLQVELAQLRCSASRLAGLGSSMSRLGGGIGTRGPGEKKLEMDRRLIKERISILNRQLREVVQNRDTMRKQRLQNQVPTAALVGYTNAGKSTLLNALTGAGVREEDKLFATLDPTTRTLELESGQKLLVTDTVGFISKLPHSLIRAFRSTLEEAKYADVIVHVADASDPRCGRQMEVVYDTLRELGVMDKKIVTAFNKIDRPEANGLPGLSDGRSDETVRISAKERQGLGELVRKLEKLLDERLVTVEKLIPYAEAGKLQSIRKYGRLETEEYREDGILIRAGVPPFLDL